MEIHTPAPWRPTDTNWCHPDFPLPPINHQPPTNHQPKPTTKNIMNQTILIIQSTSLEFREGNSDKIYQSAIEPTATANIQPAAT